MASPANEPGTDRIAHYEILREIGRGGQATVYLAEDLRLHRQVALKVQPATVLNEGALLRFRREAELASKLDHPGICPVYDVGTDKGLAWIAMRYVEGETLAKRISAARSSRTGKGAVATEASEWFAPLSGETNAEPSPPAAEAEHTTTSKEIARVVELIERVARALHVAHEARIVHRDLKPANILVPTLGDPVIVDFGLAQDGSADAPTLTATGDVVGTPAYMSPEQLTRRSIRLDRRTDVYSLGVCLYEALTLRRPFEAPTRERLYRAILTKDAPDPRRINRAISRDLAVVIETAIEKNRNRRYQTALGLAEDLRRIRLHEPIAAKPVGPVMRLQRWAQRHPGVATAVGALFAVLAIGLAVALFLLGQRDRALAEVTTQRDAKDEALSEGAKQSKAKDAALVRSQGLRLGALALARVDANPGQALLLAIEAARLVGSGEVREALSSSLATLHEERTLIGHRDDVNAAIFSSDGRRVLTVSDDHTARLWDAVSGEQLHVLERDYAMSDGAFSADGSRCLTACTVSVDGVRHTQENATVWSCSTGLALWHAPATILDKAILHPDGRRVLLVSYALVELWDIESNRVLARVEGRVAQPLLTGFDGRSSNHPAAAVSKDGRIFVLGYVGGRVEIRDGSTGDLVRQIDSGPIERLRISDDGKRLFICSEGSALSRRITLLETDSGQVVWTKSTPRQSDVALARDGRRVFLAGITLTVEDPGDSGKTTKLESTGLKELVEAIAPSPDDSMLAGVGIQEHIRVWNVRTGRVETTLRGHTGRVASVAWAPDGTRLVTASRDHTARIWRIAGIQKNFRLPLSERSSSTGSKANALAFSDDARLVAASFKFQIAVWNVVEHRKVGSFIGSHQPMWSTDNSGCLLEFEPNSPMVLSFVPDAVNSVKPAPTPVEAEIDIGIFKLTDPEKNVGQVLKGVHALPQRVRWMPSGRRLLVCSGDRTASVFDVDRESEVAVLKGHEGRFTDALPSADGRFVLTASEEDGTARIWDAATGRELRRLGDAERAKDLLVRPRPKSGSGYDVAVREKGTCALSSDGSRVAWSLGGAVLAWETASGRLMLRALPPTGGDIFLTLALSPDGNLLVALTEGGRLCRWKLPQGEPDGPPADAAGAATHVKLPFPRLGFSKDGRHLLALGPDGVARVWATETWETEAVIQDPAGPLALAAMSADGEWIACATVQGEVWLQPRDFGARARAVKPRDLMPDERDQFEVGSAEERRAFRQAWQRADSRVSR